MKRLICVVITARASYSRCKSALIAIREHPELELAIVVSGSASLAKYGCIKQRILDDGFEVAATLSNVFEGNSLGDSAKSTSVAMLELSTFFEQNKPDIVVTIADRFETIATAVAAAYLNIPLAHLQGGEMSGNIDDKVRHAITQLADIHLTSTTQTAERIITMGIPPSKVFQTGCPSIDLIFNRPICAKESQNRSKKIDRNYVVVLQHPVTTEYPNAVYQIQQTLDAIHRLGLTAKWFLPNNDPGSNAVLTEILSQQAAHKNIQIFQNLESDDFLTLLSYASCLIGNSSTGIRECSALGLPVVNIGSRQKGRERGKNVLDCDYNSDQILWAARKQIAHGTYPSEFIYGDGQAGVKISQVLAQAPIKRKTNEI